MIIRTFLMKHVLKRCVLLILVLVLSTLWVYSKCVNTTLNGEKGNPKEDYKRAKIEKRSEHKEKDEILDDIEENEILQDIEENEISNDINPISASILRENEEELPPVYNEEQKYLKQLKQLLEGNVSSRDIEFEEDFLRSYIESNDYDVDRAFSKILNFLDLRINHNYLFHNLDFDFTQYPAYRFVTVLPHRREDGSATILFELAKWDPDEVPFDHLKRIMFMVYIQELRNPLTQASGLNIIYDLVDVGYRYLRYATPQNLFLLHHFTSEVLPAKYNGIHLVNVNVIGNFLLSIIRPLLPQHIKNIFYTHSSVKELHNFFQLSMLPVQYGGNLTEYYFAEWMRKANQQQGVYPAGGQKNIF